MSSTIHHDENAPPRLRGQAKTRTPGLSSTTSTGLRKGTASRTPLGGVGGKPTTALGTKLSARSAVGDENQPPHLHPSKYGNPKTPRGGLSDFKTPRAGAGVPKTPAAAAGGDTEVLKTPASQDKDKDKDNKLRTPAPRRALSTLASVPGTAASNTQSQWTATPATAAKGRPFSTPANPFLTPAHRAHKGKPAASSAARPVTTRAAVAQTPASTWTSTSTSSRSRGSVSSSSARTGAAGGVRRPAPPKRAISVRDDSVETAGPSAIDRAYELPVHPSRKAARLEAAMFAHGPDLDFEVPLLDVGEGLGSGSSGEFDLGGAVGTGMMDMELPVLDGDDFTFDL